MEKRKLFFLRILDKRKVNMILGRFLADSLAEIRLQFVYNILVYTEQCTMYIHNDYAIGISDNKTNAFGDIMKC